jgi:hypothetical protein
MSFSLRVLEYLSPAGDEIAFKDVTGTDSATAYGMSGNITQYQVTALSVLMARLTDINNTTELNAGAKFSRYVQYKKTAGAETTIDSKKFTVGSLFIPRSADFLVPIGDTWVSTGYVYIPTSYGPASPNPAYFSISDLNQEGSYVADDLYITDYSIFYNGGSTYPNVGTINGGTPANAYDGATYKVISGLVTYNGSTYFAGEMFTASNTNPISPTAATIGIQYAATVYYKPLLYSTTQDLFTCITAAIAQNVYGRDSVSKQVMLIKMVLESMENSAYTNNVSFTQMSDNIAYIQKELNTLISTL